MNVRSDVQIEDVAKKIVPCNDPVQADQNPSESSIVVLIKGKP